ncbi:MAG: Vps62-related protein [Candidatus Electrothrix communis]|nr:MAG: Vps62-related protein [Candidatus Electrothrix communis]
MNKQEIAENWAPEVRFDSKEEYFCSSVFYYLEHVSLKWDQVGPDKTIYEAGKMNKNNIKKTLINCCEKKGVWPFQKKILSGDIHQGGDNKCTNFYLKNKNDTVKKGQDPERHSVPCYANFVEKNNSIEIQYWLFYPSNHKVAETHESDWEHVTVKLDKSGQQITEMYFSQHLGGGWINKEDIEFSEDGHPLVFCAKGTHASYHSASPSSLIDSADGKGKIWHTSKMVKIVGTKKHPTEGNEWLQYNGAWGRHFNIKHTGIPGPAYQKRWAAQ